MSRAATRARRRRLVRASARAAAGRAPITAGATAYQDWPLSDRDRAWDADAALQRWQEYNGIGSDDEDWDGFHQGFFWYDDQAAETVGGHKLPFVDVVAGEPTAVWGAITAVAGALMGARGGVDLPAEDVDRVKRHVERYYAKARQQYDDPDIRVPWEEEEEAGVARRIRLALAADRLAYAETGLLDGPPYQERLAHWSDALEAPGEDGTLYRDERPRRRPSPRPPASPVPETKGAQVAWQAVLAPEGRVTDDGRAFARAALSWRDLPLPLMAQLETADGHKGAQVAGRIDRIWREGDLVRAEGVFDASPFGLEVARLVGEGMLRGVSVDVAVRQALLVRASELVDEEGRLRRNPEPEDEPPLEEGALWEDLLLVVTDGVLGTATVVPFPAFSETGISLAAAGTLQVAGLIRLTTPVAEVSAQLAALTDAASSLTASAEADLPPAEWFQDPRLPGLTPLTVEDNGRVYGHLAPWGTCHIGVPGVCVEAPRSASDYRHYHLGVRRAKGEEGPVDVPVGQITLSALHASTRLDAASTRQHYEDTGLAVADVRVGEDEHGIWVAGALRPGLPQERVTELRGAKLSGDWRQVDGHLELVGVLAVNVPGFPVPRSRALVAGAEGEECRLVTLVACLSPDPEQEALQELAILADSALVAAELEALAPSLP
ncbi:MAG: hypothetical protein QN122_12160 [Armatimonadota bacterium]|nr:hypothetical protein [Armatimonadota bacterium]